MLSSNTSAANGAANYVEDVFSTWLYTGTWTGGSETQAINNGIDLAGKGGMTWIKQRNDTYNHVVVDSARGVNNYIRTSTTDAQISDSTQVQSFNSNGFTVGASSNTNYKNEVSWTFRKQPKFFDVVTYTGTGSSRTVAHSLGSTPGCIMVKRTDTTSGWNVYHRSLTSAAYELELNTTSAQFSDSTVWNSTAPTSTVFSVGTNGGVNASGGTYVAYIFAHDAGGFGLTGSDNVISCGSFTTDGSAYANVNLGYEPQWVLQKRTDSTQGWYLTDNMRGSATLGGQCAQLFPNTSGAESSGTGGAHPTATGFESTGIAVSATMIYIAIRRGPMKVPTDGTKVFAPTAISNASGTQNTIGFPTDLVIDKIRGSGTEKMRFFDRLRGIRSPGITATMPELVPSDTTAEAANGSEVPVVDNTSFYTPSGLTSAYGNIIFWNFKRAPSFFDEVCYKGTGASSIAITHNLQATPELIITKCRSTASNWWMVYSATLGANKYLSIANQGIEPAATGSVYPTTPTSSTFYVNGTFTDVGGSGLTYVSYLFATCAGVSKVTNFTGNGSSQTINCGFTAGARFVMIKRTDSTGDWYVWDTARGIVSGNDPHLSLNTTAAEVTTNDTIDTDASGFIVNQVAATNCNVNGASYIVLAIA